jgi:hypothetical protein
LPPSRLPSSPVRSGLRRAEGVRRRHERPDLDLGAPPDRAEGPAVGGLLLLGGPVAAARISARRSTPGRIGLPTPGPWPTERDPTAPSAAPSPALDGHRQRRAGATIQRVVSTACPEPTGSSIRDRVDPRRSRRTRPCGRS